MNKFSSMTNYFFCLFQINFFNMIFKDVETYFINTGTQIRPNT